MIRLLCMVLVLSGTVLTGVQADPPDRLKGRARWEWTLGDGKGKDNRGTFMGYQDGTIKNGEKQVQIGTWKAVGQDTLEVHFTMGDLKGHVTLKRTKATVPTFRGELKRAGKDDVLVVRIIND
jgi:hypothetical protein